MNTPKPSSMLGVSMLELMLAIALMATISFGIIGYAVQQAREVKIDQAVNDIKLLLQASYAYYSTHNNTAPNSIADLKNFISGEQLVKQNPWQDNYTLVHPSAYYLGISTVIPHQFIGQVAARLPSVQVEGANELQKLTSFIALVPRPATQKVLLTNKNEYNAFTNVQIIKNNSYVAKPNCQGNTIPKIYVLPATFATGQIAMEMTSVAAYAMEGDRPNTWKVALHVNGLPPTDDAAMLVVMTKCEPKTASAVVF